jgi:hypothetical protein
VRPSIWRDKLVGLRQADDRRAHGGERWLGGLLADVLGARPLLGRTLLPDDGRPGHHDVVVISEGLWHRRFAASPAAVGQSLALDGPSSSCS